MRTCTKCGGTKPLSEFYVRPSVPSGYSAWCRECKRAHDRAIYASDSQRRDSVGSSRRAAFLVRATLIYEYLEAHPCVDCGEPDPVVLQFDHRDASKKSYNISRMTRSNHPLERIMEEIAKCDIRCANCHFRRTAKQFGWYDWLNW